VHLIQVPFDARVLWRERELEWLFLFIHFQIRLQLQLLRLTHTAAHYPTYPIIIVVYKCLLFLY